LLSGNGVTVGSGSGVGDGEGDGDGDGDGSGEGDGERDGDGNGAVVGAEVRDGSEEVANSLTGTAMNRRLKVVPDSSVLKIKRTISMNEAVMMFLSALLRIVYVSPSADYITKS